MGESRDEDEAAASAMLPHSAAYLPPTCWPLIWPGLVAFLLVASWLAFGEVLFLNANAEDSLFSEDWDAGHFASTEAAGDGGGIFFDAAAALLGPLLLGMFPGGGYNSYSSLGFWTLVADLRCMCELNAAKRAIDFFELRSEWILAPRLAHVTQLAFNFSHCPQRIVPKNTHGSS